MEELECNCILVLFLLKPVVPLLSLLGLPPLSRLLQLDRSHGWIGTKMYVWDDPLLEEWEGSRFCLYDIS